jgi:hypothetical protein
MILLLFALWWGGFTFYSVVVMHTGHMVDPESKPVVL